MSETPCKHCWGSHYIGKARALGHGPYAPTGSDDWVYRCCHCGLYKVGTDVTGEKWQAENPCDG